MIKTDYKCKHRRIALMAVIITAVFSISACNGKKDNAGSDTGNVSGSDSSGVSGNVSGGASSNGPEGKDDVEKSIRSMAAEYGVDMPEGIVSLADPNEIYESDNMIQMKNNDLFIAMKTASDWVDSEAGLSSGKKYISVPLELNDYGFGTTRTIPDASHFYIIEAKDGNGTTLNLGAQGLRPKTDMPVSEIKSDPEQYYTSERPYEAPNANVGMNLWLLYEVPADTKEITVACWINDEFSKPFDAAFRLKVKEKQVSQNFENQSREEILKAVQTDERPDLEDFAWYRHDFFDHLNMSGSRDPAYDGYEYEGGWKCWMLCDRRPWNKGLEAHLCNLYVENPDPEDPSDFEKGYVDVRIDWYLGFDENGNVTDESGNPDTICKHEEFYYNRMENDDSSYPFTSFSFEYIQNRAVGWGRYVNEDKEEYKLAVVRPDGKDLWVMMGDPQAFTMLPGTEDIPLPKDLLPTSGFKSSSNERKTDKDSSGYASSGNDNRSVVASSDDSSGYSDKTGSSKKSDGNIGKGSKSSGKATLNDFGWYFEDDFPIDGNVLTELQDLGGNWKGIINVVTPKEEGDQCRMLVGDVEVQYMGYKVTVLMTPRERYEFMVNNPEDMITLETKQDIGAMVMEGDWNDEVGYIDAETEGGLGVVIYDFVEAGGVEYAMGKVFNSDNEIGEIAMFR